MEIEVQRLVYYPPYASSVVAQLENQGFDSQNDTSSPVSALSCMLHSDPNMA
jgi:hypothetical protein